MTVLEDGQALKKTPFFERHIALGGKMVDFGGWAMPVYYTSILQEHQAVRSSCGFFDISHMGEFHVFGKGAFQFLQFRLTNDLRKLKDRKMQYNLLCDEEGHTIDDILVYQSGPDDYYLVVNAVNIDPDFDALSRYLPESVVLNNESDVTAAIAIQGPKSQAILEKLFGFSFENLGHYAYQENRIGSKPLWISRSGYTGEAGFEIFGDKDVCVKIWDRLVKDGKDLGAAPAGLGARNTLRLEAGNVLYGHELDRTTTPLDAGLAFAVNFDKGGFVGGDAMLTQKTKGLGRHLIGFKMMEKAIARDGYPVYAGDRRIGHVTSGSYSPTLGMNIGMAYVSKGFEAPGTPLQVEIHGQRCQAEVVARPFVALKHKV